jgi:acyl-CoA synthetase (AMP-forming)/AMP-acid ligase II
VVGVTYGLTEAPVIIAGMPGQASAVDANLGSAGCAGPLTRLAVMGQGGQLCASREMGEIVARGDLLMTGYLDMPAETAAVMADGWLRTGDVGYLDERGYLFIKGRSKDVVITGGFNVYPSDVEDALAQHGDVAESVVFGIPDAHWGERVEAAGGGAARAGARRAGRGAHAQGHPHRGAVAPQFPGQGAKAPAQGRVHTHLRPPLSRPLQPLKEMTA